MLLCYLLDLIDSIYTIMHCRTPPTFFSAIMNGVDSHVTNCDNMFLNYDNSINKIRKMSTNATANCVEDEEEKERSSTLSNNFKALPPSL